MHLVFLLIQVFSSCFAGVYNEYLLKDVGADVPVMIQNVYMYVDSIICGLAVLAMQNPADVFTKEVRYQAQTDSHRQCVYTDRQCIRYSILPCAAPTLGGLVFLKDLCHGQKSLHLFSYSEAYHERMGQYPSQMKA